MTGIAEQIIVFYILGLILFIIGMEEKRLPQLYIYLGLSFFVNMMGYYRSYSDPDYVTTAYLPLVLDVMSIILLIYNGFKSIQISLSDKYETKDDD